MVKETVTVYRFGDQSEEKTWAYKATDQIFGTLVMLDNESLASEWVIIQTSQSGPVAFVDLINGTVVPFNAVRLALPK